MSNFVGNIVGSLAMYIASVYVWKKLYEDNISWSNSKIYVVSIFMIIFGLINYFYNFVFVRVIVLMVFLFFTNKIIFNKDYKKTVLSTILAELLLTVADLLFGLVVLCINGFDINKITMFYGTLLANVTGLIISISLANLKIVKKIKH